MRILIAEDEYFYRHLLVSTVREWGYDVVTVDNGLSAWEHLSGDDAPQIAIIDWMMPGLDGLEVCRKLRALVRPEPTYVIMLTAREGKQNIVTALESGADDFVTKPFYHAELRARIQVGLRIVGLQTSQSVVFAFARAAEAKSPYTQGHAARVTEYALDLAAALGLSASEKDVLRRGGLLHDIGKISIPDAILDKPGKLTADEMRIIQQHPVQGVKIIEPLQSLHDVIPLVRWHHERLDGRGYPDGLRGDAIPLLVRILTVADIYDALSSHRPYRQALPHAECLDILRKYASDGGLDGALVERFCTLTGPRGKMVVHKGHGIKNMHAQRLVLEELRSLT
jgi:putative two-component system response regulator